MITKPSDDIDHVVSVVGWSRDEHVGGYGIVCNSWGEYWGKMGCMRVGFGALSLEGQCFWAVVKEFTAPEKAHQVHCHEGGDNCRHQRCVSCESARPDGSSVPQRRQSACTGPRANLAFADRICVNSHSVH